MIYKTKDVEINDRPCLAIMLENFPETWFVLGEVSLTEENGTARLKYYYDIIEGKVPDDKPYFEKCIGDFIVWYMDNNKEDLIYKGGS